MQSDTFNPVSIKISAVGKINFKQRLVIIAANFMLWLNRVGFKREPLEYWKNVVWVVKSTRTLLKHYEDGTE